MLEGISNYQVIYPDGLGEYEYWEIEQKGWLDIKVMWGEKQFELSVFDPVRLGQVVSADVTQEGHFVARRLLVVPAVTREEIGRAVARLAARRFSDVF
jgi:hypothetical protein